MEGIFLFLAFPGIRGLIFEFVIIILFFAIASLIYISIDSFFLKFIYPTINRLIYRPYKNIKLRILRKYNDYFDDYIFFTFFISTLVLTYLLFYRKEIDEKYIIYRVILLGILIVWYWIKDVKKKGNYKEDPSFLQLLVFAVISLIYTKIFIFMYIEIICVPRNNTGALIFIVCRMFEDLIYSGTYQYLKKYFRGWKVLYFFYWHCTSNVIQ